MSELLERFKKFKNSSPIVTVSFPKEKPEFEFTIEKIPPEELRQLQIVLFSKVKDNELSLNLENVDLMFKAITKHIKGWNHLAEEKLEFNTENLKTLFNLFTITEMAELITEYNEACKAELEKKS